MSDEWVAFDPSEDDEDLVIDDLATDELDDEAAAEDADQEPLPLTTTDTGIFAADRAGFMSRPLPTTAGR